MKRLRSLSESGFLKLFFVFIAVCLLVAAVCMPDRGSMFTGLWQIVSQPSKLSTNNFAVGGLSATFLNVGLVAVAAVILYSGSTVNNVSTLAYLLTLGFSFWGINILNMWFAMPGVVLYGLVKKQKLSGLVNAMLFSTGLAPLATDLMIRYPGAEVVGFHPSGVLLALAVGAVIGFFLPAGMAFAPKVHKGYDHFSAALPLGMTAFFLQGVLYKSMGVDVPAQETVAIASRLPVNLFCCIVFGLCLVFALALGCKPGDYLNLLKDPGHSVSYSAKYGNAAMLMNVGVYGLFIVLYYNLIGAPFSSITLGVIFCMLCCCNSGSHPGNVLPILLGYVCAAFGTGWLSGLIGGNFAQAINAQAIVVGACFASGLSPISGKYGWQYGLIAGMLHYFMVTTVPSFHGGFCLYNGGFTAGLVCLLYLPILEHFCKTKEERLAAKAH